MRNHPCQQALKRVTDVAVAATILLVCLPVLGCVALWIRRRMGRPVLFRQRRPGLDGRPFLLYKFRTMDDARGPDGQLLPDARRLSPLGRFLRRTSLDELPQLWNVLRGEMSLVGPRPLCWHYLPYFTPRERLRHTIRPGITGWAQIHGRNQASWEERYANDVWYVERWSLWLDCRILCHTIAQVFRGRAVVVDARSIMKNLDEERRHILPERRAA